MRQNIYLFREWKNNNGCRRRKNFFSKLFFRETKRLVPIYFSNDTMFLFAADNRCISNRYYSVGIQTTYLFSFSPLFVCYYFKSRYNIMMLWINNNRTKYDNNNIYYNMNTVNNNMCNFIIIIINSHWTTILLPVRTSVGNWREFINSISDKDKY